MIMLFKWRKRRPRPDPVWLVKLARAERRFWVRLSIYLQKKAAAIPQAQMKWGCVFVIVLFCLLDTWILVDAVRGTYPRIHIQHMPMPVMTHSKSVREQARSPEDPAFLDYLDSLAKVRPGLADTLLQISKNR